MTGHHRGSPCKVSYPTREQAVEAGERRRAIGMDVRVYRCKSVLTESTHPVLRARHWHLTSRIPRHLYLSAGFRLHEAWNEELTARVVGCLLVENTQSKQRRAKALAQRARKSVGRAADPSGNAPSEAGSDG